MNTNEYIANFTERAEQLATTKLLDCPPYEIMKAKVEDMIEHYYQTVGKYPKSYALEQLGNYLLVSELKNKDVDKVTNTPYPILSEIQIKRRNRKQVLMQDTTLDFINTKYHKELDSLAKRVTTQAENA